MGTRPRRTEPRDGDSVHIYDSFTSELAKNSKIAISPIPSNKGSFRYRLVRKSRITKLN